MNIKNKIVIKFKNKEKNLKSFLKEIEFLKPFYLEFEDNNKIIVTPSLSKFINEDLETLFDENMNILESITNRYEYEKKKYQFFIDEKLTIDTNK